jgi:ATP-binding cassette subfamily F protein 3
MSLFKKQIDWANRSDFEATFPAFRREQIKMDNSGVVRSKIVEIKGFSLRNPYNTADIFLNTKLIMQPNKRCAVYGVNGSGKTCLFDAIATGEVPGWPKYLSVHHMKELEHDDVKDAVSVLDTVVNSSEYRNSLINCETMIKKAMEEPAALENPTRMAALKGNLDYVVQQKGLVHGENAVNVARSMLRVLGFDEVGEQAPLSSLSGGLRMRVALACAFFINPDVLLLDEPTNHLDLPSVLWLENKLRGYKGSFLLVTHDRTLLENVVSSVMLIQDFKLENFPVDFKQFEIEKENADKHREKQVEEFMRLNRHINADNPKYKIKLSYEKWLDARYERNILLQGKFTFSAPLPLECPPDMDQKDISLIKIENLRFSYNPGTLPFIFDTPISYDFKIGTRVGIMGPNGAGKSTLLKLMTGKLEATSGTITRHPDFVTAYFGQHSTKELDLEASAIDFMQWKFPTANVGVLRSHLAKTSVGDSIAEARMKNLSFSQRSCVIFAALTFVPPHLLIMDEPTNFLDLESVDSLIKAANKFSGGLVVVTHNRDFLKKTVSTFLSIIPGAFLEFGTMKEAERATYSFITALESGQQVDFQQAIQDNRGGGAIHNAEDQAIRAAKLAAQQRKAKEEADAIEAERVKLENLAIEKEKARIAKQAALKDDWAPGDKCYAPIKGKWVFVEVIRNVPSMGVTCQTPTGAMVMVEAKKMRADNPEGAKPAGAEQKAKPVAPASTANARGGAAIAGGARGGRGGAAGGRGGAAGGRGGARGGASGNGRGRR